MIAKIISNVLHNRRPVHLILHITNKCQLKCKTCFNKNDKKTDLNINYIKKISDYLNNLIWLDISGGEPFLREDLPEICSLFNTGLISISTNGQNPQRIFGIVKSIRRRLEDSVELSIAISIDGFQKTNDYIRGENSFSNAIKTINILKKIEGIKVKVNTVLCEQNYNEVIEFMKFIKTLNSDFHSIILLRGMPRDSKFKPPKLKELVSIKKDIFKIWDTYDYGIKNTLITQVLRNYQKLSFETSLKIIEKKEQIPKCLAGIKHLVVRPNGDVSFCEMLNNIGNIKHSELNKILNSKKALIQKSRIKASACFCHHNCNMLDNFFLNPLKYPLLLIKK